MRRCWGTTRRNCIRLSWRDLTHPDDLSEWISLVEQMREAADVCHEVRKRFIHRSGGVNVGPRIRVSTLADTRPMAISSRWCTSRTSPRQKRSEDAPVRERRPLSAAMADSCPTMLWVTSSEGGTVFINKAWGMLSGVTLDVVEGGNWQLLVHPEDRNACVSRLQEAVRTQTSVRAEAEGAQSGRSMAMARVACRSAEDLAFRRVSRTCGTQFQHHSPPGSAAGSSAK